MNFLNKKIPASGGDFYDTFYLGLPGLNKTTDPVRN